MNKTLRLLSLLAVFMLAGGYASAQSGNITFADAAVKAICVANWDPNGDGELSYDEAAAVKNLSSWVFSRNTDITSFDELQYFTGLKSIGTMAFSDCSNLTNISIPSSVANIGDYAFSGCASLTSVTIPSSVASIGGGAFSGCSGLNRIKVDNGNSVYDSRNDCNAIIETASNTLIVGCQNTFIHDGVINIGDYAFEGCKGLTNITIPSSVASIGEYAFEGCKGLTNITIPSSVASIGEYAFGNCLGLTSVTISDGIASIGENAFYSCYSLASITIPKSVTSIGDNAFEHCYGLTSIIVEGGNETYDSRNDCNAIIETSSNKLIVGCQNTIIPDGVVSIGDYAFEGCAGLASMTIPEGVISIGKNAFNECTGLTSVTIPSSVTSIGEYAFGFANLNTVTSFIKEPFEITDDVFMYSYDESWNKLFTTATLYVPAGTKEKYLATPAWNQFQNIVELGLEPVEQGETIDYASDINADTDLDGNVVGDIYYSISSGDGSYDPSEGCIVVTSPTDDDTVNGLSGTDIFGEDFNDHFTGIVFKVAEGKGTIKIEAQTTGTMVLKVKIGDNEPIEMELEGRLKVSFPYNVSEDTYVYIYGGESAAQANSMRRAAADSALKIYGIEVVKGEVDGIGTVMTEGDDDAPVYNLSGQRVKTPHRGVYIQNGKKVLVK